MNYKSTNTITNTNCPNIWWGYSNRQIQEQMKSLIPTPNQIQSADGVINSHPVFIDAAPGEKTEREYINTNESWGSELRNTEADRNTGREHMNTNDNASVLENWDATTKTRNIKGYIVNVIEERCESEKIHGIFYDVVSLRDVWQMFTFTREGCLCCRVAVNVRYAL